MSGVSPTSGENYWARLREAFLAEYPICPDCGAPWDLDTAGEEYGAIQDAIVYSIATACSAFQDDEDASREPAPHPLTDGLGTYAIAVRGGQVSVHRGPI